MNREQVYRNVLDAIDSVPAIHSEDAGHAASAVLAFLDTLVDDTLEAKILRLRERLLSVATTFDGYAADEADPETARRLRVIANQRRNFAARLDKVLA